MGAALKCFPAPRKQFNVLMMGLNSSGKTTLLYRLVLNQILTPLSTIGFNAETLICQGLALTLWDVGYREGMWRLWAIYYTSASALIFVLDASDSSQFATAKEALDQLLDRKELQGFPLLVLANKQDLPGAQAADLVVQALALHSIRGRHWHILETSAVSAQGLNEGLDWLATVLAKSTYYGNGLQRQ